MIGLELPVVFSVLVFAAGIDSAILNFRKVERVELVDENPSYSFVLSPRCFFESHPCL